MEKIISPHSHVSSSAVINHDQDNASETTMSTTATTMTGSFCDDYHSHNRSRRCDDDDDDVIWSSSEAVNQSRDKNYHKLDPDQTTLLITEEGDLRNRNNDVNDNGRRARIEPVMDFNRCRIVTETTLSREKCDVCMYAYLLKTVKDRKTALLSLRKSINF